MQGRDGIERVRLSSVIIGVCLWSVVCVGRVYGVVDSLACPVPDCECVSGSFAELRFRHFHSGTDFRTQAQEGIPICAVADGEVSRVHVSTGGYGLAVYVQHAQGLMTLYGHLRNFAPRIDDWVKKQQYSQQKYQDVFEPPAGTLRVRRGDTLGFSGNTGGSRGPHLHFETRLCDGESPVNAARYGLAPTDRIPPTIERLAVYVMDTLAVPESLTKRKIFTPAGRNGVYRIYSPIVVPSGQLIGLGVRAFDRVNVKSLTCGIASWELYNEEGEELFHCNVDSFAFSETANADVLLDYHYRWITGRRLELLYQLPGNLLSIVRAQKHGYVILKPGERMPLRVVVGDAQGNKSTLSLVLQGAPPVSPTVRASTGSQGSKSKESRLERFISWNKGGALYTPRAWLRLSPTALFYSCNVALSGVSLSSAAGTVSPVVRVHDALVPIRFNVTLMLRDTTHTPRNESCYYLARYDGYSKGRYRWGYAGQVSPLGDREYAARIRHFGIYALRVDTVAPHLDTRAVDRWCTRVRRPGDSLRIKVWDSQTPIALVEGFIEGKWVLWEQEPKLSRTWFVFDPARIGLTPPPEGEVSEPVNMTVRVVDALGNQATHVCSFRWQP